MRLCSAKRRGHDRPGRVETSLLARSIPIGIRSRLQHTGETRCAPLLKIQKQAAFVIIHLLKNKTSYEKSMNLIVPRIAFRIFR